ASRGDVRGPSSVRDSWTSRRWCRCRSCRARATMRARPSSSPRMTRRWSPASTCASTPARSPSTGRGCPAPDRSRPGSLARRGERADLAVREPAARVARRRGLEAAPHACGPEAEREILLDVRRLHARRLFLVPEARERLAAGRLARLLVLPGEEALVDPLRVVLGQEIVERGVVALHAPLEIELH